MQEKQIEEIAVNKIIEYAKTQPTEVWHQMVIDWNWDSYKGFLEWLIDHSDTDKGTILMIYWKSAPGNGFTKKQIIEERYRNGYYKQQSFSFDPKDDEGDNWVSYLSLAGRENVPEEMFQKLNGTHIGYPKGFIEGMPEALFYEIEELYE